MQKIQLSNLPKIGYVTLQRRGCSIQLPFHDYLISELLSLGVIGRPMCSDCQDELFVLKGILDEEEEELLKRVVLENEDTIANSMCTESQNGDDHKSKYDLLVFVVTNHELVIKQILSSTNNCEAITGKLERLLRGKKWERMIAKLYVYLIKNYAVNIPEEIALLERIFSSVKEFEFEQPNVQ